MGRTTNTLVLAGPTLVARADFVGGACKLIASARPTPAEAEGAPERLVDAALRLGGRCGGRVWVLSEDVWTQTLTLPSAGVAGLSDAEVGRALAFEVEALSGNEAGGSAVGFRRLGVDGGGMRFWVSQLAMQRRRALQDVVARRGGTLAGVCHPGGAPNALNRVDAGGGHWKRVELWRGVTVCLAAEDATGDVGVTLIAGDVGTDGWRRDLLRWRAATNGAVGEWFTGSAGSEADSAAGPATLAEDWPTFSSTKPEHLKAWLGAWSAELDRSEGAAPAAVPVIPPGEPIVRTRHYVAAAAALVIIAATACGWDWDRGAKSLAQLRNELRAAEGPRTRRDQFAAQARTLHAEVDRLTAENDRTERSAPASTAIDLRAYRGRLVAVLRGLAAAIEPDVVVARITGAPDEPLTISGHALSQHAPDAFAGKLRAALTAEGWEVHGATTTALQKLPNGGPWSFDVRLVHPAMVGPSRRPAATGGATNPGGQR